MKGIYLTGLVIVLAVIVLFVWTPDDGKFTKIEVETNQSGKTVVKEDTSPADSKSVFTEGEYSVVSAESTLFWAGKKPLIEGYINSGALSILTGMVDVSGEVVTANFTIDMNTLVVSETKAKPGKETMLEGHLKSDVWFNVAEYPEASFTITEVASLSDSQETFIYNIKGNLTMKGETHELSFPAKVYLDSLGRLVADAAFEFDRTKWGITAGSRSFFDSLADNVIDDMVALSFHLVAEKN